MLEHAKGFKGMATMDIFKELAIQSKVRLNSFTLHHFHLNKINNSSYYCLALSIVVARLEYSHNRTDDHTRETQFGLSQNLKLDTNPPSSF